MSRALRGFAVGALALLAALAAPRAPLAQGAPADRQALVAGLQAQYEVSLIRERKMADDRETQMIGLLEARLRAARTQADAAKGDARQANAALAQARADYAKLAGQLASHDPEVQADVNAYHAQAEATAQSASPAKLAALQRFADGDRTGAWPVIEAETNAAAKSQSVAQQAKDERELAGLRDIMRAHGEATDADVLALYDKAAALDPSYFMVHIQRASLARDMGDLPRARAAAQQAIAAAQDESQRAIALRSVGEQAAGQGDDAEAAQDYDQALVIFRRYAAADPTRQTQNEVAIILKDQGDLRTSTGDFKGAASALTEALQIRRALAAADPSDSDMQDFVTSILMRIGDLDIKVGDLATARAAWEEGLAIRKKLLAADPANTDLQYYTSAMMRRLGDLAFRQGDMAAARAQYEQCLAIRERLSAANPSSAQLRGAVALDEFDLGEVDFAQNDIAAARLAYEKSYAIRKALEVADPTDAGLQQFVMKSMTRLARLGDTVTWSDVAAQYRLIRAQGHLIPNDDMVLQALRAHGLAAGL